MVIHVAIVVADVVAGIATNYATMLLARAILGIGDFWAIAVGLGTHLVPEEIGQRATSVIFGGISIGTIVGVPAGPLLGHLFGGRSAFLIVAALGLLPRIRVEKVTTLSSLTTLVKSRNARVGLTITFFTITAQFTAYTSVAPFLEQQTGASAGLISTVLAVIVTLGLSALMMPLLGQWSVGAFVILSVWGLAYGGAPVAMQTWVFNADAETANESGSGMFVATFQFSIAFGSFFGGIVVDLAGIPVAMYAGAALALTALVTTLLFARTTPWPGQCRRDGQRVSTSATPHLRQHSGPVGPLSRILRVWEEGGALTSRWF
jgi:predicted MFS family arabinose efflux permease